MNEDGRKGDCTMYARKTLNYNRKENKQEGQQTQRKQNKNKGTMEQKKGSGFDLKEAK